METKRKMSNRKAFGAVPLAVALALTTLVSSAALVAAHKCTTYGTEDDAEGCNAHSCPDDGTYHKHTHDTPWNDFGQIDHGCESEPSPPDLRDLPGPGSVPVPHCASPAAAAPGDVDITAPQC